MGLSKRTCKIARGILRQINPAITSIVVKNHNDIDIVGPANTILGYDKKMDGGWENIFTDIHHMTDQQRELWEEKKGGVHNTPFCRDKGNGWTRIGWI